MLSIVTSNELRHSYFITKLSEHFPIDIVVIEPKQFDPASSHNSAEEAQLVQAYFSERTRVEKVIFGSRNASEALKKVIVPVGNDGVNSLEVVRLIKSKRSRYLCVYGSSILKKPYFNELQGVVKINMHLGLSPYYRGSGTNFFPFVNNELSCVGTTIHLLSETIDGGGILNQVRPSMQTEDSIHSVGNKAIIAGTESLVRTITALENGISICPVVQDLAQGKQYYRRDFNAAALRKALSNIDEGVIPKYLLKKHYLDKQYPIVENAI